MSGKHPLSTVREDFGERLVEILYCDLKIDAATDSQDLSLCSLPCVKLIASVSGYALNENAETVREYPTPDQFAVHIVEQITTAVSWT
jgi:hypothetical protein